MHRGVSFVSLLLGLSLISLTGCTPEKGQAVKNAAATFQNEASSALSQVDAVLKQAVAEPPKDITKMASDLDTSSFTAETLQFLLSEGQSGEKAAKDADKAIAEIQAGYDKFSAMFDALPKGSYFAANEVEKAQKYAANLTIQMVNLANKLESNEIQVKFNARRILLVEQITQHNTIKDAELKDQDLQQDAQQILALGDDEAKARDTAAAQCLKAAEAGRTVLQLIKDFKTLSVGDMLSIGKDALGFAAQITNQNAGVLSALHKYNNIALDIQNDPYWSPMLDVKINAPAPAR